jgi:hypothetical protein
MSIATLFQVYDEVRRLSIAGSSVAPGDFRLKKLVAPLEQAGAKVPVFAKVAQSITAVVDSTDKTAAAALLELTTLVSAVLYTQGETGLDGTIEPIPTTDLGIRSTNTSARTIKPLIEALTTTGSGRVEIVKDAIDRNLFRDLRLIQPAVRAIDDPYPEVGDLIVKHVLPLYGKSILPDLRASFDLKSKTTGHQRRLKLMHKLDAAGSRDLVEKSLAEGSKEMKVAAIECLGATEADVGYLIEQSKAKAQDVRSAALRAMLHAPKKTVEMVKSLLKALEGEDIDLVMHEVTSAKVPAIDEAVIDHARKQLAIILKEKDAAKLGPAIIRMMRLINCTEGREDAAAEKLLADCLEAARAIGKLKTTPAGADLNEVIAFRLATGSDAMKRLIAATADEAEGQCYDAAILAARGVTKPAEFYDRFNSHLVAGAKKNSRADDRCIALKEVLSGRPSLRSHASRFYTRWSHTADESIPVPDPRWIDLAIERKFLELACTLAVPGHAKSNAFLLVQYKELKDVPKKSLVLQTMLRVKHPASLDLLVQYIKSSAKTGYSHTYATYEIRRHIADLPKSALPTIEALIADLPEKFVDSIVDGIAELRTKPDEK